MPKILTGTVVSLSMKNTAVVEVERTFRHRKYKKIIRKAKRYKVHMEDNSATLGDTVRIQETRPISKDKHFTFIEVVKK